MSLAHRGKQVGLETRLKLSRAHTGKKKSEETRRRMSEARKGWVFPPDVLQKLSLAKKGPKCHFWKGGVTPLNKAIRMSMPYRHWRKSVFERDNYTCQECGARSGPGIPVELNADHIKPFHSHPELRFDVANGRTLCRPCHLQTETWGKNSQYATTS